MSEGARSASAQSCVPSRSAGDGSHHSGL